MDQVPAALVTKWFWEAGCCAAGKKENDGDSNSGALLAVRRPVASQQHYLAEKLRSLFIRTEQ